MSIFYSCSTLNISSGEKIQFKGIAVSAEGKIQLPVPRGWFSADSSSIAPLTFLIIKRDGSASISFTSITLTPKTVKMNLNKVFEYAKAEFLTNNKPFVPVNNKASFYKAGTKECMTTILKNKKDFVRLVVFKFKRKYFQSLLHSQYNPEKNAPIQDELVNKLKFNF
jgi:hypothetical protein